MIQIFKQRNLLNIVSALLKGLIRWLYVLCIQFHRLSKQNVKICRWLFDTQMQFYHYLLRRESDRQELPRLDMNELYPNPHSISVLLFIWSSVHIDSLPNIGIRVQWYFRARMRKTRLVLYPTLNTVLSLFSRQQIRNV